PDQLLRRGRAARARRGGFERRRRDGRGLLLRGWPPRAPRSARRVRARRGPAQRDGAPVVPRTLVQAFAFLFGMWLALSVWPSGARGETAGAYADLEASLHRGVNDARAQQHLIALERRADLDAVALAHSRDMVARHYFAHESPEGHNALDRLQGRPARGFSPRAGSTSVTT